MSQWTEMMARRMISRRFMLSTPGAIAVVVGVTMSREKNLSRWGLKSLMVIGRKAPRKM